MAVYLLYCHLCTQMIFLFILTSCILILCVMFHCLVSAALTALFIYLYYDSVYTSIGKRQEHLPYDVALYKTKTFYIDILMTK